MFALPVVQSPVHLIRYESLVKNDNIYSIMLYECDETYTTTSLFSQECSANVPYDIATSCLSKLVYVWGTGNSMVRVN